MTGHYLPKSGRQDLNLRPLDPQSGPRHHNATVSHGHNSTCDQATKSQFVRKRRKPLFQGMDYVPIRTNIQPVLLTYPPTLHYSRREHGRANDGPQSPHPSPGVQPAQQVHPARSVYGTTVPARVVLVLNQRDTQPSSEMANNGKFKWNGRFQAELCLDSVVCDIFCWL